MPSAHRGCTKCRIGPAGEDRLGDPEGATAEQIKTIQARAYNATARAMAAHGVTLTSAQADDLGGRGDGLAQESPQSQDQDHRSRSRRHAGVIHGRSS